MDFTAYFSLLMLLVIQLTNHVHSLRCYTCVPMLQNNEDCGTPSLIQLQNCELGQDVCRSTAVSLPTNGVRVPTINRGCAATSDFSGSQSGFLQTGTQRCTTSAEGQRVSKLCLCNYDGCNALTMGQLTDNQMFGGAITSFSVSVMAVLLSVIVALILRHDRV